MGCAQSRNGGYYYPSFLEGPVDRINSSDPQSAVDFVDRVLDQIDLALDGERPTPTRTFTAAEAEVVETAWRGAWTRGAARSAPDAGGAEAAPPTTA